MHHVDTFIAKTLLNSSRVEKVVESDEKEKL